MRSELRFMASAGHCDQWSTGLSSNRAAQYTRRVKAVQLVGPQQLRFVDVPAPTLEPDQVLVRMNYLAVCGSDLKFYDRTLPETAYPLAPGRPCHECVGTIVESTVPQFSVGQRVIALPHTGALVECASVPAGLIVPLPENPDVDPALWVLCQPMGTVMYAMHRIGSVLGKRVVVVGAGPIGLCFTDLLVRHGAAAGHRHRRASAIVWTSRASSVRQHVIDAAHEDVARACAS